jgi:glucose/arabinose dehydrogenase
MERYCVSTPTVQSQRTTLPKFTSYCYGNRNPEGIAWQPGTDAYMPPTHGSSAQDEVNFIEPGKNYGWPAFRALYTQGMVKSS